MLMEGKEHLFSELLLLHSLYLFSAFHHHLNSKCVLIYAKSYIPSFFISSLHTEPRGYSDMMSHVGVDALPDASMNCHRMLSATHSASIPGTRQRADR